ncbi:amiloride-sensitive sodium channel domain-containing protein [Ditylenchus destructor]|uniref:Amiloride-sensitive sodium channel domain-containing protein n=1 Tax=Ditylenchus destructor TaxID=166010 RepID=A0AAD4MHM7_9BILA|nr:amiloride-sensitive sodium channel domain-containing protein [Ditylenchus destructor]
MHFPKNPRRRLTALTYYKDLGQFENGSVKNLSLALKSSIQILVDLFAFDNQVDDWRGKEAKIFTLNRQNKVYSSYDSYYLIAGRHVDLNVASVREDSSELFKLNQETFGYAKEDELEDILEATHPQIHNRQRITYKIDQGYGRVRLFNYEVSEEFKARKQSQRDDLSKNVQKMGNDAFLPKVHTALFKIIGIFFEGHLELLKLFDRNMENIMNKSLLSTQPTNYCSEMPSLGFATTERQILELVSSFWDSENENPGESSNMVRRLNYDTSESVLVRDLRSVINKRAARSQFGEYEKNNFASIQFRFRSMTKMEITDSTKYKLFNLLVDTGSTLGLYFGMTILTLFELIIFAFYRDASRIQMQSVPPQSVIYNLPRKPKKKGQQQKASNIQRLYNTEANSILPTIF